MASVKELNKKVEGLFKQVNDLKEEIKEKDDKIDSLKTTFNNTIADLKAEINDKQTQLNNMQNCDEVTKEVQQLQTDNVILQNKVDLLENLLQKQSQQISTLKNNITEVKQCTMQDNVIIAGIKEHPNENCKRSMENFLENTLGIIITDGGVQAAYRTGSTIQRMINGKKITLPQFMLVRCTPEQKNLIMSHVEHLKGKKNEEGIKYFIVNQMPDAVKEQCRQNNELIKEAKEKNQGVPKMQQLHYKVQRNQLYINGNIYRPPISAPQPQDLFKGPEEQIKLNKIVYTASEAVNEQESYFTAFVTKTDSIEKVQDEYTRIAQICGDSDHIMCAYSVRVNGGDVSGYVDDGEHGGGTKLRSAIENKSLTNVSIFVAGVYGGVHLGEKRFRCIAQVAKQAIDTYVKNPHKTQEHTQPM